MKRILAVAAALALLATALPTHATIIVRVTSLTAAAENNPADMSPGFGTAEVIIDTVAHTMRVIVTFGGLQGTTTASHIHCCAAPPANAGVATTTPTFAGFPLGVTSGTYDNTLDLTMASSYNPAFVSAEGGLANAEAALVNGIATGLAYLNIHTNLFPGGEIRGQLAIPEPGTLMLLGIGIVAVVILWTRSSK